ncbi:MAG: hypothetical protein NT132_04560 [Microbacterium sp.]|uniref:hypothetical protein n=1 Tax=Microbacterium sp. TaxID=51671 RepID=UPI0026032ACF|nr:hypothetical protein [Microbacterium sp.]MCX6501670.1 hypothetical protein [Microbacterium sp.]
MLFVVSLLLFLLGMAAMGIAFSLDTIWELLPAISFVAGILLITAAMALPMHMKAK